MRSIRPEERAIVRRRCVLSRDYNAARPKRYRGQNGLGVSPVTIRPVDTDGLSLPPEPLSPAKGQNDQISIIRSTSTTKKNQSSSASVQ
jgi:hypothetical protein